MRISIINYTKPQKREYNDQTYDVMAEAVVWFKGKKIENVWFGEILSFKQMNEIGQLYRAKYTKKGE